ncbi:MAG: hypothetical protein ACFFCW_45210 [Candidatus Hodarchaeota archaeon]
MSANQAFKEMLSRLNPTERQHEAIRKTRETIDTTLKNYKKIHLPSTKQVSFFTGSYSRKTIIRPIDDIDLYVRIHYGQHAKDRPPIHILSLMRGALHRRYPNTKININLPCIVISFLGYKFEIVPAVGYEDNDDLYEIPAPRGRGWIQCYPNIPDKWISSSNQANNEMFIPLIKVLKQWRRNKAVPLKSFHLEMLTEMVFNNLEITDYPTAVYAWMHYVSQWIKENNKPFVLEPGKSDIFVDQYLYENPFKLIQVRKKIDQGVKLAHRAFGFWRDGKEARARFVWKVMFGDKFPLPITGVSSNPPKLNIGMFTTPSPTKQTFGSLFGQRPQKPSPNGALFRALLKREG